MDEKECVLVSWFYKVWDKSFHHGVIPEVSFRDSHRHGVGMHSGEHHTC